MNTLTNVLTTPKRLIVVAGLAAALMVNHAIYAGAAPVPQPVVNINTATEAQLVLLPGVGPKLAREIFKIAEAGFYIYDPEYFQSGKGWVKEPANDCDHRCHFKNVDDLLKVKGIGVAKLAKLRPYVAVSGTTTATAKIHVPVSTRKVAPPVVKDGTRCGPGVRCGGAQ